MLLLLALFAQLAWAEVTVEIKGDEVIAAEKDANGITKFFSLGKIVKKEKGTRVFHWGSEEDSARWLNQGKVDSGELDFLINQFKHQAAGGGFYASFDALDSAGFGPQAVALELQTELKGVAGYSSEIIDKVSLAHRLREKGLSYIAYGGTWVNFIDPQALQSVGAPTLDEYAKAPSLKQFESLAIVEKRRLFDLNHPEFKKKQPIFQKIMTGKPIDAAEKAQAWNQVSIAMSYPAYIPPSVAKFFRPELEKRIAEMTQFGTIDAVLLPAYETMIRAGRQLGFDFKTILGPKAPSIPKASLIEFHPDSRDFPNIAKLDAFGQKLARAMEFMDYDDLMSEMAKGASEPWRRYDADGARPLLDRWLEVTDQSFSVKKIKITDEILAFNRVLSENANAEIRDTPKIAEGDIVVNGKKYYRLTELEKQALESNKYLTVEIISDPTAKVGEKLYLGRHEYPSARTFHKFENLLTPELLEELKKAEADGNLDAPGLTRKVLQGLYEQKNGFQSALEHYLEDLSLSLFTDHNEITARAMYQLRSAKPLFVRDFDRAIFMAPEHFIPEAINGEGQLMTIRSQMLDELKRNPTSPKYYDIPEFWQLAVETDLKPKDPAAFVSKTKAMVLDKLNQICVTRRLKSIIHQ